MGPGEWTLTWTIVDTSPSSTWDGADDVDREYVYATRVYFDRGETPEERSERLRQWWLEERRRLNQLTRDCRRLRMPTPKSVLMPDIVRQQRRALIMVQRRFARQ